MDTSHHSFLQIVHLFNTYLIRSQVSTYMYLAAHIENVELYQDNAPCHTTRSTLLEWCVRVQASYPSTIFYGPGTIGLRISS